ncbi:MAG TPA: M23 family metallopeptidase [Anaerolineaceae bacterium]|nr:M23 family metallopeptidase [Anaerolineaceae bacterium]
MARPPKTRYNAKRAREEKIIISAVVILMTCTLACAGLYVAFLANLTTTQAAASVPTAQPTQMVLLSESTQPAPAIIVETLVLPTLIFTPTPEPVEAVTPLPPGPTPNPNSTAVPPILYYAHPGDTLNVVAVRFGVSPDEISSPEALPANTLLQPEQLLIIPNEQTGELTDARQLMPDAEVVYSPSASGFDTKQFAAQAGGKLSGYQEYLGSTLMTDGSEIVARVARDNSINPRLLLALLEYHTGWVYGQPEDPNQIDYPLNFQNNLHKGLYKQLTWAVDQLMTGYYGWREGRLTSLTFTDGSSLRISPELNAGTVALMYLFSVNRSRPEWEALMYSENSLPALYEQMFGNPWVNAQPYEPLLPASLAQPDLLLPFASNQIWAMTGGPHTGWGATGAWAALDFAPAATQTGCVRSGYWAQAVAPGVIIRSERGVVILDLDGDGDEQTGWVILYLHMAELGRVKAGTYVQAEDNIGHPSCEGGAATGTHLHIARKYNGEWIAADGPLPFVMSDWQAQRGSKPYEGGMVRGDRTVTADPKSPPYSYISRLSDY